MVYQFSSTLVDLLVRDLLIVVILATSKMPTVFSSLLRVLERVCDALPQQLGEHILRPLLLTTATGTTILPYVDRTEEGARTVMTITTTRMMTGTTVLTVLIAVIAPTMSIDQDLEGGLTTTPTNRGHPHLFRISSSKGK